MKTKSDIHPLRKAGLRSIALSLEVSYEAVRKWALRGEVPLEYLPAVVRLTAIPPRLLSPGLYRQLDEVDAAWAAAQRGKAA
jgi:hypothetical protein